MENKIPELIPELTKFGFTPSQRVYGDGTICWWTFKVAQSRKVFEIRWSMQLNDGPYMFWPDNKHRKIVKTQEEIIPYLVAWLLHCLHASRFPRLRKHA